MHFDINPLCDSLKKQLRSLSRREMFYLLKDITEGVLGQVLGCDVREHLLGRRVVKGDGEGPLVVSWCWFYVDVLVDVRLEKCYHHVHLPNWPSVLACDGEYCPYAPDTAHWGVASPVVDPSLLYVALNDESGFEPSVYLLLENEA